MNMYIYISTHIQVIALPYDTSLKLTIARYYTPSGRCIQVFCVYLCVCACIMCVCVCSRLPFFFTLEIRGAYNTVAV